MDVSEEQFTGVHLYALLVSFALAAFLISLDGMIVNVAIPTISGDLGVREDVGTWVITVFTMANTLFIPVSNRLSLRFGDRAVFTYGLMIFCAGSVLCAFAYNFNLLLIFRVFQGAGAGLILPVSLSLIITHFPESKRAVAVGFWSFFAMVGPAMGPMVGGWLSAYNWHYLFIINLPICLAILLVVYVILGPLKREKGEGFKDWVGLAALFLAMGTLQVALNRGQIRDWFRSDIIPILLIISVISLVVFIVWECYQKDPFLDLSHFKKRNFTLACTCMGLAMGVIFSSFILDSLWVYNVLGYTPAWEGLTLAPVGIFPIILYPIVGRYVTIIDVRIWVIGSFILYACTFFWLSRLNVDASFFRVAFPRFIQGIGFPFFTIPCAMMVVRGIRKHELTGVISFFSFMRMMGVAIMIPLITTLWIHRTAFYRSRTAEQTFATNPAFLDLVARFEEVAQSKYQALDMTNRYLVAQESTLGLCDIYYAFGWFFLALAIVPFFFKTAARPPKNG